jgi:hypothetical protein
VTAIDTAAFGALLRGMDRATFARFVAAVFEARGRTVTVEDGRLRLDDGRVALVHVDATTDGVPDPPADADLLVTAGEPPSAGSDTEVLGPADLRERLLYGVDPHRRAAVAREFLGEPLVVDDGPDSLDPDPNAERAETPRGPAVAAPGTPARTAATGGADPEDRPGATGDTDPGDATGGGDSDEGRSVVGRLRSFDGRALAAVALVVLGAAGAGAIVLATGPEAPLDGPPTGALDGSAQGYEDRIGDTGDSVADAGDAGSGTVVTPAGPGVSAGARPPGVAADGSIDEETLAEAHTAALAGRSYRLTLTVRVYVDGQPVGLRRESIRVANATSYSADVTRVGSFPVDTPTLADGDVYANGSARVERIGPSAGRAEPVEAERPYADRVATYLRWYLSVEQSRVAEVVWRDAGGTDYWLTMRGDPWPGVADTTGTALVTTEGMVRELRRSYRAPDRPSVSADVTLRVSGVGRTTVVPPAWYRTMDGDDGDGGTVNATAGAAK